MNGYTGKKIYHGEMHEHSASGGTSDGKMTLAQWNAFREEKGIDFIAILDHRQVRHMYLPEYQPDHAIFGTEPGTGISDADAEEKSMHYNMLFPRREDLEELLAEFPEYEFTGGVEGHFVYPQFTRARFAELIAAVKKRGGMLVHPHPKQLMRADDPNQYAITDWIGLETLYENYKSQETKDNYALWLDLLHAGRRVWACAGCDSHGRAPDVRALTSVYAEGCGSANWLKELARGNFACGPVGMQMEIGDTVMGGCRAFAEGDTLSVRLGDAYAPECGKPLRLEVLAGDTDDTEEIVYEGGYTCGDVWENGFEVDPAKRWYRVVLWDGEDVFGIGNPIWNE